MKIFTFSFKSLLIAAGLMLGSANAWADGEKRTLYTQNYEAASDASDWNAPNMTPDLETGDATYGQYIYISAYGAGSGNRSTYKTFSYSSDGYTSAAMTTEGYVIEFDALLQSGNSKDNSKSQFILATSNSGFSNNGYYTGTNYIFAMSQPTNTTGGYETTWYINDLNNETASTVSLTRTAWYHYIITVSKSSVGYVIKSGASTVASGSKSISETNVPIITRIWALLGRGAGQLRIDNIDIYDYSLEEVSSPTISSVVNGANRTVTITSGTSSLSKTVKTYYTTDGSDPTSESAEYTTTPLNITENCTVKAISISSASVASSISSLAVTVGEVTLATPTITASGFTNTMGMSVNNPTFSFACNNSAIEGNPTATLSYTFTPYGGVESSATEATSYTPTAYGTLKVIASADGYTSSEKSLVVSSLYTVSYTGRDYTTATTSDISTTEGVWGDEFDVSWDGWASGLKAHLRITDMSDDYRLRIRNTSTINYVSGWGWVRHDKSYNYGSRYAKEGYFVGLKINTSKGSDADALTYPTVYCASGSGKATDVVEISVSSGDLVQQLYFYEATPTTVSATIGSTGWTTFASSSALDLSKMTASEGDVEAFYASAIGDGNVTLTSTDKSDVAAGQGIMLKGTAGATITIPVAASGTSISGNKLIGCTAETPLSANADYYVLVNNGGTADFQSLEDNGATIPAGKAYLDATAGGGAKILRVVIDGQASEVVAPEVAKTEEEEILFNMAGIQVDKNFKGFVVNQKGVKRFNR